MKQESTGAAFGSQEESPAFRRGENVKYFDVSCSNCGNGFHIPDGRNSGFSHCDQHAEYGPGDDW